MKRRAIVGVRLDPDDLTLAWIRYYVDGQQYTLTAKDAAGKIDREEYEFHAASKFDKDGNPVDISHLTLEQMEKDPSINIVKVWAAGGDLVERYIRTGANDTDVDNLPMLPKF